MSLSGRSVGRPRPPCAVRALVSCMLLFPVGLPVSHDIFLVYIFPLVLALLAVTLVVGRLKRQDSARLESELKETRELAQQRERERDLAQEELFRRLYEERELNKEKMQFQAQLAEYEKYAALAQLALGAAHEINNPLLGILSHLELELKSTTDEDRKAEIEQCVEGAKRISATLRGLLNYPSGAAGA
jgi:C4-dicarboxylate-specific signal transduction histidine kinase